LIFGKIAHHAPDLDPKVDKVQEFVGGGLYSVKLFET
jgi:hypothetical protein